MDAIAGANILYFDILKAVIDHLTPTQFELPDSVGDLFEIANTVYHEASILLALEVIARSNAAAAEILDEFEKLVLFGLDEPDRGKYAALVGEAMKDLRRLFSDEDSYWRDSGFARRWLASVGVVWFISPVQPGTFSSFILTGNSGF